MNSIKTPLSEILQTTKTYLKLLEEMEIRTVEDLLLFFPRTHESLHEVSSFSELRSDAVNTVQGVLRNLRNEKTRTRKIMTKASLITNDGTLEVVWFQQPFLLKTLPEGEEIRLTGKVKYAFGKMTLQSPRWERGDIAVSSDEKNKAESQLSAVYSSHDKVTSNWIREKMKTVLHFASKIPENLPAEIRQEEQLLARSAAVHQIHFPDSEEELARAKERLAFEELFAIQLRALEEKKHWQTKWEGEKKQLPLDPEKVKEFLQILPFEFTTAQKISLFEILKDFDKPFPMSRLLEGDVGSGKTIVVAAAAAMMLDQGYQVAVMAPTEVLARQHALSFGKIFNEYGKVRGKTFGTKLLIGALSQKEKRETLLGLATGTVDFVCGTHALVQEKVQFCKLGFAVIDEQHRFGVAQRDRFKTFGSPHLLTMTATPIPRTLALVAYGDQDLSVINELPPGRKPIHTKVVPPKGRTEIYRFIESEIEKGRQVYIICPLVEESETIDVKAATEEHDHLSTNVFPHFSLGLMHGRLSSDEKSEVMKKFKDNEHQVLVSTSVVEVGVDVPNATIILIEGAERFGLSQLHQFRGRVGRGAHQSFCFLFTDSDSESTMTRMKAMEKYADGFHLAEIDMRLRGPGEVYGVKQSGIPDLKMANFSDARFVDRVRKAAERFLIS